MAEEKIWLVTGGAGFIGSNIAEELVRRGKRVRILDNLSTGKLEHMSSFKNKVEFVRGDIRAIEDCRKAVKDADFVIHQAAIRSVPKSVDRPTESNDVNITGTLNMLVASKEAKVKRVVYASSSSVFGDAQRFPQKGAYKPQPISPYAVSKLAGEHYAIVFSKTFGLETVSLRYFNVFGPRQDPGVHVLGRDPEIHGAGLPGPAARGPLGRQAVPGLYAYRQRRLRQPSGGQDQKGRGGGLQHRQRQGLFFAGRGAGH